MPLTWKLRDWLRGTSMKQRLRRKVRRTRLPVESLEPRVVLSATGSVSGFAFIDANGDGVKNFLELDNVVGRNPDGSEDELVVKGATLHLTGTSDAGATVNAQTTTDQQGAFSFTVVPAGTYTLKADGNAAVSGTLGNDVTVVVGTTAVTKDVPIDGIVVNGELLLNTSTSVGDFGSLEDLPLPTAGTGQSTGINEAPVLRAGLAADVLNINVDPATSKTVDLTGVFDDSNITTSQVQIHTSDGDVNVNLLDKDAPQTVQNFYNYVNSGAYDNSIFHRLASGFVLQGGGFKYNDKVTADPTTTPPTVAAPASITAIPTNSPVKNEFDGTNRSNLAGTVAMAKLGGDPDSATNQFFFNLADNSSNLDNQNGGFTVFGRLVGPDDTAVVNKLSSTTGTSTIKKFDAVKKDALQSAVTSTNATTITVTSAAVFPTTATPFTVLVDSELMSVTSVSGTTFTVTRGVGGTIAANHAANAIVTLQGGFFGNFGDLPLNNYNGGLAPLAGDTNQNQRTSSTFPTDTTSANFLQITGVDTIVRDEVLTYSVVSNSNRALFSDPDHLIKDNRLMLNFAANASGTATIVVRATDKHGVATGTVDNPDAVFHVTANSNPVFTSAAAVNVAENTTAVQTVIATDSDLPAQAVTYSIVGGADQAKFTITSAGVLTFQSAPDRENPTDADLNNVYVVQVQANDGNGGLTKQTINVTVTGVNDNNPTFTSADTKNVAENTTAVLTVTATDADKPTQTVTYSLVGGADQAKFNITSAGVLTFQSAPDFENPTDADHNNEYLVVVQASDGNGGTTTQNISVVVTGVNESPVFTSPSSVNVDGSSLDVMTVVASDEDMPIQTVTYSITGGVDQDFFMITSGGVLTFNLPGLPEPSTYTVVVQASDGVGGLSTQTITVIVGAVV